MTDLNLWCQQVARTLNSVLGGKQNSTLDSFTLTVNSTSSILTDSRIGNSSYIHLVPMTENAASTKTWISQQKTGQATISHDSVDDTDRTYRVIIVA